MTIATVKWSAKFERVDLYTAQIDPDNYALWAEAHALPKDVSKARAMDIRTYIREYGEISWTCKQGEAEFDEYALPEVTVELFPNEEFHRKQLELALFLFNMNNGPCESVATWLDEYGDTDYYENYMADAEEVLKSQPHLLSLPTREEMGLDT